MHKLALFSTLALIGVNAAVANTASAALAAAATFAAATGYRAAADGAVHAPPPPIPVPNLGTCSGCGCADPCMGFAHAPTGQHPKNCSLPQVLLIGDSIAGPPLGYSEDVQRILGMPTPATVWLDTCAPFRAFATGPRFLYF